VGSTRTSGLGGADSRAVASATRPTGFAFGLLATVQGTLILTVGVISVLLPAIQRDLGLSDGELALVNTAFGLSFSGLLLLGARVADLVGRRRALRVGMAAFGLASIAAGLAPTLGVLLAARFAEGAGAALAASAAMALLGAVFPDPDRRARAIAIWGGVSSAGALGGVLLSGVFASWASWRWAFAIPVTVAVVAVVAAPRLLPTGPAPLRARLDVPGALLATGGVSALSYGLVTTLDRPWASAMVLVPLPGGAGLLAVFLAVESRVRAPLLPPGFLSAPRRAAALLALLVTVAGIAGSGFIFALYFQQIRGWSALQTSAAFLPYLLILATSVVAGRLVGRAGPRAITTAGLVVAAAGLLLFGQLGVASPYVGALLGGMLLFPLGAGLTFAGATVAAVDGAPEEQSGLAAGVLNTAMELGPTVGLALLVSAAGAYAAGLATDGIDPAVATTGGYAFAFTAAAVVFALTAAMAAVALRTTRPIQTGEST